MTRIEKRLGQLKAHHGKAFIPYLTAGDRSLEMKLELVLALEKAGADLIEVGVPFSHRIAGGPVIHRATDGALRNGVTLPEVQKLRETVRINTTIVLALIRYFSP